MKRFDPQTFKLQFLLLNLKSNLFLKSETFTSNSTMRHSTHLILLCFTSVELLSLLLCVMFCYHTKTAPALYNESIAVAFAVTNEATWMVVYILIR